MPPDLELFLIPNDIYRIGNAQSPRLDNVRKQDVDVYIRNGVQWVRANGKGISLFTWEDIQKMGMRGWVWKLPKGVRLPNGLKWINDHGGHYMLALVADKTLDQYKNLLDQVAAFCQRMGD